MNNAVQKIEYIAPGVPAHRVDLLKSTICRGCTNEEMQLFLYVCERTGLDPFLKQIYPVKRKDKGVEVMTIQTSIDGLRLIADRTRKYSPGKEPSFVYDAKGGLVSATSYIKKMTHDGTWHEVSATAYYGEYVQLVADYDKPGQKKPGKFWIQMPHVMLAKCSEAACLRRGFPAEMSGLYSDDEMQQADRPTKSKDIEEERCEVVTIEEKEKVSTTVPEIISSEQLEILEKQLSQIESARVDLMKFLEMTTRITELSHLPSKLFPRVMASLNKKIAEKKSSEEAVVVV